MNHSIKSLALLSVVLLCASPAVSRHRAGVAQPRGVILSAVPQKIDKGALYLFCLHGRIVEQGRRPTHPDYGAYEYDQILDAFKQRGFVVISEQRKVGTDIEQYGAKVARQVRRLLAAGVPPRHITVVGASQGAGIAMLASTYLKNRRLNFVIMAGCSANEGFLRLVNLHGNVLSIYEQSDQARSCDRYRADATGIADYREVALNTGLRHGFIYRPMSEWVEPAVAWAQAQANGKGGK